MKFDLPKELSSIIKVIGVGGGGSNAVNHMYAQGIKGVDFIVANTDRQALDISPIPVKLQLGPGLTEGLGAGSIPERGKDAAQENLDEIRQILSTRTKMLFITAGMGGGTGTGAAPVVATIAREAGILTVGIVTMPFMWEGPKRKKQALAGMEELRNAVDTLLVINNDRLREQYGNLSLDNAFEHADNVLATAARGIVDIITKTGKVNVDFEDVRTVMTRSGVAIMGMAETEGEDRALRAAQEALDSPLLNDNNIAGAKFVLLNIEHGTNVINLDEIEEITSHIQQAAGSNADLIFGYGRDESLDNKLRITGHCNGLPDEPRDGRTAQQGAAQAHRYAAGCRPAHHDHAAHRQSGDGRIGSCCSGSAAHGERTRDQRAVHPHDRTQGGGSRTGREHACSQHTACCNATNERTPATAHLRVQRGCIGTAREAGGENSGTGSRDGEARSLRRSGEHDGHGRCQRATQRSARGTPHAERAPDACGGAPGAHA